MKTLEIPHTKMCKSENSTTNCSLSNTINDVRSKLKSPLERDIEWANWIELDRLSFPIKTITYEK
jgi:hypothetical protein